MQQPTGATEPITADARSLASTQRREREQRQERDQPQQPHEQEGEEVVGGGNKDYGEMSEANTSGNKRHKKSLFDDGFKDEEKHVEALDIRNIRHLSENRRFAMMTAACFAMICGSTSYAFNIFSGSLQKTYSYDFRAMSTINTVGMVFCYFLQPYGFLFDMFGPRIIYTIGCVLFPLGALLMGLSFQGVITGSVVRFAVYNAMLSLGSQLFDLATVIVMLSIFPTKKGWVVALLKTLMGLGQAVLACIQSGLFSAHPPNYFYFLMCLVVVVGTAVQLIIRLPSYHLTGWQTRRWSEEKKALKTRNRVSYLTQEPPMWRFYYGIAVILVLVVYLPLTSALVAFLKLSMYDRRAIAIGSIVITCLMLGLAVPCPWLDRLTTNKSRMTIAAEALEAERQRKEAAGEWPEADPAQKEAAAAIGDVERGEPIADGLAQPAPRSDTSDDANAKKADGGAAAPAAAAAVEASPLIFEVATDIDYLAPQYQTPFLKSIRTLQLWSIFWTMFCGVGSEFVIIFNARFLYGALNGAQTDDTVSALLTVINGVGSAVGRLAMSYFEVYTQNQKAEKRMPITASFFVPTTCIMLSIVLFLVLPGRSLLVAFAVASLGNGFCASITILVLRTIYAKDPAKHYNFGYNALWVAAILLNRLLFGEWYAVQADKRGEKVCLSRICVQMPLIVMLAMNATAFVSNVYLHIVYCRFSRRVLAERAAIKEQGMQPMEPLAGEGPELDEGEGEEIIHHLDPEEEQQPRRSNSSYSSSEENNKKKNEKVEEGEVEVGFPSSEQKPAANNNNH